MIERNVGGWDRRLRAGGAALALGLAAGAALRGLPTVALFAALVGAGLGFNAATGFCLGNKLLGVNTCEWSGPDQS